MLKPTIAIFLIFLFGGCSKQYHPLTASKKARLVIELVIDNARCSAFKARLGSPSVDDDAIEEIYRDAMKARCINKDV
ncbi:MAG: hypothetical protein ACXW11_12245 [Methylotenera sp.]